MGSYRRVPTHLAAHGGGRVTLVTSEQRELHLVEDSTLDQQLALELLLQLQLSKRAGGGGRGKWGSKHVEKGRGRIGGK